MLRADHHPDKEGQRVLAQVACNLAPTPPSLGYTISPAQDAYGHIAVVTWTGPEDVSAEDLASARPGRGRETKAAEEWLTDLMDEHGGRIRSTVVESLRRDEEFSLRSSPQRMSLARALRATNFGGGRLAQFSQVDPRTAGRFQQK